MIGCKVRIIHERSDIISIPQNLPTCNKNYGKNLNSYDLNQNCFDPSKSSPPNEFMMKLRQRMTLYDCLEKNDFNRDKA